MLQPLSLLTFNLDLLFQHHRLEADSHVPACSGEVAVATPQPCEPEAPRSRYLESLSVVDFRQPATSTQENRPPPVPAPRVLTQTSPQLLWVQEAEIAALEEDSLAQQAGQVVD